MYLGMPYIRNPQSVKFHTYLILAQQPKQESDVLRVEKTRPVHIDAYIYNTHKSVSLYKGPKTDI